MEKKILSLGQKHVNILTYHPILYDRGKLMGILKRFEQMLSMDIADITLAHFSNINNLRKIIIKKSKNPLKTKQVSVIAESHQNTNKEILKTKLNICNKNIPTMKSSKILEVESISKEQVFSNLSKGQLMEISKKLLLHTKTDYVDSDMICSNGSLIPIKSDSWFSMKTMEHPKKNLQKMSFQSSMFSHVKLTGAENIKILKKKIKKKKPVALNNKIICNFVVTKKIGNTIYGRTCSNSIHEKNTKCIEHLKCKQMDYDKFIENTCKHIITQKTKTKDRKGMYCGDFCELQTEYCRSHNKQHINIEGNTTLRSYKVRFYPTIQQREKLAKFYGCCRTTYNLCIDNAEYKGSLGLPYLRDNYITKNIGTDGGNISNAYNFLFDTPKEIRTFTLKDYITAVNNANEQYKKKLNKEKFKRKEYKNYIQKEITKPIINYRLKKDDQCITINKNSINIENNKIFIYKESFSKSPINVSNRTNKKDKQFNKFLKDKYVYHDIKILKTVTNKYYLCISHDVKIKEKEIKENIKVVACDPGLRTFMATYDTDGTVKLLGEDDNKKLRNLHNQIDKLKNNKQKKNLLEEKITNKVSDMHYKIVKILSNYDIIYLPEFNTQKMLSKENSILTTYGKRELNAYSHYKFKQKMINKCEILGKELNICKEILTTQTCGNCFNRYKIEGEKIYTCPTCKYEMYRDPMSARNIMIQNIIYENFK